MAPEDALDARLRRRWAKRGGGPELERKLKAAEAELARRADVATAERRGVRVPETSRVPVSDPTTRNSSPRASTEDSPAAAPRPPPGTPIRVDEVFADARALTRSQTRRAAASAGPHSRGIPPHLALSDDDESDDETRALEAGCRVVTDSFTSNSGAKRDCLRGHRLNDGGGDLGNRGYLASPATGEREEKNATKTSGVAANEASFRASSRETRPPPTFGLDDVDSLAPFLRVKAEANDALREGDVELAAALYDEAIERLRSETNPLSRRTNDSDTDATQSRLDDLTSVFLSNRAHVRLLLSPPDAHGAVDDAEASVAIRPDWHRPYDRAAKAHAMLGNWKRAVDFCRDGELAARERDDATATTAFANLLDQLAMRAANEGSLAGFYGRLIYVRSAGEEAWLCREAPANAAFDDDVTDDENVSSTNERYERQFKKDRRPDAPIHARSLREAIEKARDGDRVVLLRGIHNGCGDSVTVTKRVLISGEGALRDASVDARNNSPVFRLRRACWIVNVDFDFTGFSEALRVESGDGESFKFANPLIERCSVKCSGSDGVVVDADARPTFRDCAFEAKKTGLRVCGASKVELVDCKFAHCERQGLRLTETATAVARNCVFAENGHEGVVAMGESGVVLNDCVLRNNRGPGLDVSGTASARLDKCVVSENVGGVFVWDVSSCEMENGSRIEGGASHALLIDTNASCACFDRTRVFGVVHAEDKTRRRVAPGDDGTCAVEHPAAPTDLPPETGCFKFEHDQYLRKQ
jgi:hypothetical protein